MVPYLSAAAAAHTAVCHVHKCTTENTLLTMIRTLNNIHVKYGGNIIPSADSSIRREATDSRTPGNYVIIVVR